MSYPFLSEKLKAREGQNALRRLSLDNPPIDFTSNDYLGFVRDSLLKASNTSTRSGSTGSRLLSGNSRMCEELEEELAQFYRVPAALILNSGYQANLALISSIAQRRDTIIYDEYAHASIRDGARLSFAKSYSFRHNDLDDLRVKMRAASGDIFVVMEALYSMDGDYPPLESSVDLCREAGAHLILDEAHSTGVHGAIGEGLAVELGLHPEIFARVHTFGKAAGCHGAAIVGDTKLKEYLVNFARPFIYTTALPDHSLHFIKQAHDQFKIGEERRSALRSVIQQFTEESTPISDHIIGSASQIQGFKTTGNEQTKKMADHLRQKGYDVRPILSPTVPEGLERIRICLHSYNSKAEVSGLVRSAKEFLE